MFKFIKISANFIQNQKNQRVQRKAYAMTPCTNCFVDSLYELFHWLPVRTVSLTPCTNCFVDSLYELFRWLLVRTVSLTPCTNCFVDSLYKLFRWLPVRTVSLTPCTNCFVSFYNTMPLLNTWGPFETLILLIYIYIYRRHFRQSVVNMPFHPFYLHLVLHILYIQLYYTHRLYTLFTLCFIYYLYFMCILRLDPCTNRLCTFQSNNLFNNSENII